MFVCRKCFFRGKENFLEKVFLPPLNAKAPCKCKILEIKEELQYAEEMQYVHIFDHFTAVCPGIAADFYIMLTVIGRIGQ